MAMDNVRVLKVDTGEAQTSVKDLKNQLKALKDTLVSTTEGTEEYNTALAQAAEIQHELKEQMEQINATAMDFGQIMGNVVNATGGIVSGFQAAKATMNLFGVENEGVMKSLQKMQNLMAITQALPGVEKGIKSLKNLVTVISNATATTKSFNKAQQQSAAVEQTSATSTKALQGAMVGEAAATGTATVATNMFKKALISTGIGAVVVLVGTLIAHLEDLAKWLGFGGDSAEELEKKTLKLKQAYEYTNSVLNVYSLGLESLQFEHEQEIKALDLEVEKRKAAGASEAELAKLRQANFEKVKEMTQDEIDLLNNEQSEIEKKYLELMKGIAGATYNTTLSMENMYRELAEAQHVVLMNEQKLESLEAGGASDKEIAKQKSYVEEAKQRVTLLQTYIGTQKEEVRINDKLNNEEVKLHSERKKRSDDLKKSKEDLAKFDAQLLIESKRNQEKELAQLENSENEKKKQLEKFRKEGVLSAAQYQERLNQITANYAQQRNEIIYKYEEKAAKQREEIDKKNTTYAIQNYNNLAKANEQALDEEAAALEASLRRREISFTEYFNQQTDIAARSYENQKKLLKDTYNAEADLIATQLQERQKLLTVEGITDDEKQRLLGDVADLTQQLTNLTAEYELNLREMTGELNATIADMNQATIEAQMDSLRMLTENVVSAMDAIAACGNGISSEWGTAFDTMANGLINLGQKIKEGTATWSDYGQMAVAAFSAAGSMMSALADEQETETEEGFEQQKKYQIAAATMNMLGGVVSAWTSAMNPANAWMTIWGQIAMGAATTAMILTTGIMQIQKIKQQQFEDKSSKSSSPNSSAVASVIAPVQYTQDVQGASIEGAIKDSRVYVVESDITDTQEKVSVTENEAKY